jgi:hypothetical protein
MSPCFQLLISLDNGQLIGVKEIDENSRERGISICCIPLTSIPAGPGAGSGLHLKARASLRYTPAGIG